jgi:hypothetical protein
VFWSSLIELGIEARKQKEKAVFELTQRFRSASRPEAAKQFFANQRR